MDIDETKLGPPPERDFEPVSWFFLNLILRKETRHIL